MTISITEDPKSSYQVATEVFQGPLDLLLQLIERAELDISKLALSEVTDQFLDHMKQLTDRRVERVSEFLLVATRLMQIKSEALLPRPVVRLPDEEDPGEALGQQLIIYKRYKEIAKLLAERQSQNLRSYLRLAPPPKVEGKLDLSEVKVGDLYDAALRAFRDHRPREPLGNIVTVPKVTIREKIRVIATRMGKLPKMKFRELFEGKPERLHVVVTFLAMLELVRRYRISATQSQLFGEIELERDEQWDENLDFDIEFSE